MSVQDKRAYISHSRLGTLSIVCQKDSVIPARLQFFYNGKFIFFVAKEYPVADRFAAGFRVDGLFINIELLKKLWEIEDKNNVIIAAEVSTISEKDEVRLKSLFNGPSTPQ